MTGASSHLEKYLAENQCRKSVVDPGKQSPSNLQLAWPPGSDADVKIPVQCKSQLTAAAARLGPHRKCFLEGGSLFLREAAARHQQPWDLQCRCNREPARFKTGPGQHISKRNAAVPASVSRTPQLQSHDQIDKDQRTPLGKLESQTSKACAAQLDGDQLLDNASGSADATTSARPFDVLINSELLLPPLPQRSWRLSGLASQTSSVGCNKLSEPPAAQDESPSAGDCHPSVQACLHPTQSELTTRLNASDIKAGGSRPSLDETNVSHCQHVHAAYSGFPAAKGQPVPSEISVCEFATHASKGTVAQQANAARSFRYQTAESAEQLPPPTARQFTRAADAVVPCTARGGDVTSTPPILKGCTYLTASLDAAPQVFERLRGEWSAFCSHQSGSRQHPCEGGQTRRADARRLRRQANHMAHKLQGAETHDRCDGTNLRFCKSVSPQLLGRKRKQPPQHPPSFNDSLATSLSLADLAKKPSADAVSSFMLSTPTQGNSNECLCCYQPSTPPGESAGVSPNSDNSSRVSPSSSSNRSSTSTSSRRLGSASSASSHRVLSVAATNLTGKQPANSLAKPIEALFIEVAEHENALKQLHCRLTAAAGHHEEALRLLQEDMQRFRSFSSLADFHNEPNAQPQARQDLNGNLDIDDDAEAATLLSITHRMDAIEVAAASLGAATTATNDIAAVEEQKAMVQHLADLAEQGLQLNCAIDATEIRDSVNDLTLDLSPDL